jgi:hypothetical protein
MEASKMPESVPTIDDHNELAGQIAALDDRVTALETATPPVEPPIEPPVDEDRKAVLLKWLAGLAGKAVIPGQYHDPVGQTDVDDALYQQSGEYPALTGEGYWRDWDTGAMTPADVPKCNDRCLHHWGAGGLVCITSFQPNPSGHGGCQTIGVNVDACLTPGTREYDNLRISWDQEITGFKELDRGGVIILYRPLIENKWGQTGGGGGFWWGIPHGWGNGKFGELWRQRRAHYDAAGLTNIIWTLSQYTPESWPGDGAVDTHGEDVYADQCTSYQSLYDAQTAAHPNHPWWMTEWGSGNANAGGSIDLNAHIENIKTHMPRTVAFHAWSGKTSGTGWALCQQRNTRAAMANPYCLPLSRLGRPL